MNRPNLLHLTPLIDPVSQRAIVASTGTIFACLIHSAGINSIVDKAIGGVRREVETMYVKNCMTPDPISITPSEDVNFAIHLLKKHGFRQLPVIKNDLLIGVITDRDLRGVLNQPNLPIESVMTPQPVTISEDATVEAAAQIIRNRKINALPVISKDDRIVGIITVTDILDGLINMLRFPEEPVRIQLRMSKGVDLFEVIKLLQTYSEKVVSFTSASEDKLLYYFWVIHCDYDKLDSKLKERRIDAEVFRY